MILFLFLALLFQNSRQLTCADLGGEENNNYCWIVVFTPLNWYDSEAACRVLHPRAHLVSFRTLTEKTVFFDNKIGNSDVWVGLNDIMDEAGSAGEAGFDMTHYVFTDGSPYDPLMIDYFKLSTGPTDVSGTCDCLRSQTPQLFWDCAECTATDVDGYACNVKTCLVEETCTEDNDWDNVVYNTSVPYAHCIDADNCPPFFSRVYCDSILQGEPGVCNDHGDCESENYCNCNANFDGTYCDACENPAHKSYPACSTCVGYFEAPACTTCLSKYGPPGVCNQCVGNFQLPGCTICSGNFLEPLCTACDGNFAEPLCTTCLSKYGPPGVCNQCVGNFLLPGCTTCSGNFLEPLCTTCDGNFAEPLCTTCLTKYGPPGVCNECIGNYELTSGCVECVSGYSGTNCNTTVSDDDDDDDGNSVIGAVVGAVAGSLGFAVFLIIAIIVVILFVVKKKKKPSQYVSLEMKETSGELVVEDGKMEKKKEEVKEEVKNEVKKEEVKNEVKKEEVKKEQKKEEKKEEVKKEVKKEEVKNEVKKEEKVISEKEKKEKEKKEKKEKKDKEKAEKRERKRLEKEAKNKEKLEKKEKKRLEQERKKKEKEEKEKKEKEEKEKKEKIEKEKKEKIEKEKKEKEEKLKKEKEEKEKKEKVEKEKKEKVEKEKKEKEEKEKKEKVKKEKKEKVKKEKKEKVKKEKKEKVKKAPPQRSTKPVKVKSLEKQPLLISSNAKIPAKKAPIPKPHQQPSPRKSSNVSSLKSRFENQGIVLGGSRMNYAAKKKAVPKQLKRRIQPPHKKKKKKKGIKNLFGFKASKSESKGFGIDKFKENIQYSSEFKKESNLGLSSRQKRMSLPVFNDEMKDRFNRKPVMKLPSQKFGPPRPSSKKGTKPKFDFHRPSMSSQGVKPPKNIPVPLPSKLRRPSKNIMGQSDKLKTFYKVEQMKDNLMREFIETEEVYVKNLELLKKEIIEEIKKKNVLKTSEFNLLFKGLNSIIPINGMFLKRLKQIDISDRLKFYKIVGEFSHAFKLYTDYIGKFKEILELKKELSQKNKSFRKFLEKKEMELDKRNERIYTLESFLILPVQRIPRYKILIGSIVKQAQKTCTTSQAKKELVLIEESFQVISKIAVYLDNQSKIFELHSVLSSLSKFVEIKDLMKPYRKLNDTIKDVSCLEESTGEVTYCNVYLLTDILIVLLFDEEGTKALRVKTYAYPLKSISVSPVDDIIIELEDKDDDKGIKSNSLKFDKQEKRDEFFQKLSENERDVKARRGGEIYKDDLTNLIDGKWFDHDIIPENIVSGYSGKTETDSDSSEEEEEEVVGKKKTSKKKFFFWEV